MPLCRAGFSVRTSHSYYLVVRWRETGNEKSAFFIFLKTIMKTYKSLWYVLFTLMLACGAMFTFSSCDDDEEDDCCSGHCHSCDSHCHGEMDEEEILDDEDVEDEKNAESQDGSDNEDDM